MSWSCSGALLLGGLVLVAPWSLAAADPQPPEVTIRVYASQVSNQRISHNLTGKFCEHLGANIYNGMDAQILRNATFADFPFWTGQMTPDGITTFQFDRERIENEMRRQALRYGWPEADLAELSAARADALACFWSRTGSREQVQVSPDTGPHGGRAQRLELKSAGVGIKQWAWLPLHRIRSYQFEVLARSPELKGLTIALTAKDRAEPCASGRIENLTSEWKKMKGTLQVPADARADVPYCLTLSGDTAGQVIVGHCFLWPADHVHGADPDVIRFLKDAHLPLLRWPGGNFVSAYHWEDGIGPVETRPTKPNYAWGGVEPNTFGTDEFMAFCRAVGCEPMICINAGTGTPQEAARWVQYCNDTANSPIGARRATNGHREPYHVRHWEVGNELWGHWQARWTTAEGYVDRYVRFAKAMRAADPKIELHACGAPVLWGKPWNETLIHGAGRQFTSITDHPLIGGNVSRATDPLDVFRDFMLIPDILESKWRDLEKDMSAGGIRQPRLAITELQMFAHLGSGTGDDGKERLTHENLVTPGTLGEALYDTLIYHAAVRLGPFVELLTHSATVNHGGGLRKEHERVYANPCHYANGLFAAFAEGRPVKTDCQTASEQAPIVLPEIRNTGGQTSFSTVDVLAALAPNGDLLVSAVHRGTKAPVTAHLQVEGFVRGTKAQVWTLSGPVPWAANTLEHPHAIQPVLTTTEARDGSVTILLPSYSVVQIRYPGK